MAPIPSTVEEIDEVIFHDVIKPIASALKEDGVHWTTYGPFFFCLVWMGYNFGPPIFYFFMRKANEWHDKKKKPRTNPNQEELGQLADQVNGQSQLADQIAT
jgi:hypothetical protein